MSHAILLANDAQIAGRPPVIRCIRSKYLFWMLIQWCEPFTPTGTFICNFDTYFLLHTYIFHITFFKLIVSLYIFGQEEWVCNCSEMHTNIVVGREAVASCTFPSADYFKGNNEESSSFYAANQKLCLLLYHMRLSEVELTLNLSKPFLLIKKILPAKIEVGSVNYAC